ncbi:hypothetical protein SBV1_880020 [Verrucomicrobia bacterium]|nr:hypothetical protein SBV1_880020 [Verrucomicrobiota bacterium]
MHPRGGHPADGGADLQLSFAAGEALASHRPGTSAEDYHSLLVITCLPFLTVWLCAQPRKASGLGTKPNSEKREGIF